MMNTTKTCTPKKPAAVTPTSNRASEAFSDRIDTPTHATIRIGHPFNVERKVLPGTKVPIEFSLDGKKEYEMLISRGGLTNCHRS